MVHVASPGDRPSLGRLLVERGALDGASLERALSAQRGSGRKLGEVLVERGDVDVEALARTLAAQLGLSYAPPPLEPAPEAVALVRPELARSASVVPLAVRGRVLSVAVSDPLDHAALDDVRFQSGRRLEVLVASHHAVHEALTGVFGGELEALVAALPSVDGHEEDAATLERAARAAPVVRLVDHLLAHAIEAGASDVHVERHREDVRVRIRVDGLLHEVAELPGRAREPLLSRLKVMAGMDIAVKRRPQDGRISLARDGRRLTLRVSTLPVSGGEKAVLRILDPRTSPRDLGVLGLEPSDLRRLRSMLRSGRGVVLATGPTGSGKSSTLQAALREVDRERLNVVTLEDPVEARLPGVTHVQVDPRAGLDFPTALRAVLRQDPDVVMVGEIRDRETAEIAMAAAVTGHLVLSTLHTTDAPGALTRLLDMGVPPWLVAGGLTGVVAQRLVRRVCRACGGRSASGCGRCRSGYAGRTGVFQVLSMTDPLREALVRADGGQAALRRLAEEAGMATLADDARRKIAEGITTPHEVGRVLHGGVGAGLPCRGCEGEVPDAAEGCPWCGRPRHPRCRCGRRLEAAWRFCPACLARAASPG